MTEKNYAMSSYLAFRFLIDASRQTVGFSPAVTPVLPARIPTNLLPVSDCTSLEEAVYALLGSQIDTETGVFLSGGMDSAILASYLPAGTKAYTICFIAPNAINEAEMAELYAKKYHLDHHIVEVHWEDYEKYAPELMKFKKAPLHAIEVALYKAALQAKKDGIKKIVIGNGADSNYGGLDKLLSKDWTFDEFVNRYTFCQPSKILKDPCDIVPVYQNFKTKQGIDTRKFLGEIHGIGVIQSFENALKLAGIEAIEPFESTVLSVPMNIERIRRGDSKYIIRELFAKRYPNISIPDKIAFARPMDQWLKEWQGPTRPEFLPNCIEGLSGDQKWLVYCLEWFLNLHNF